ncbi:hypothetical protein LCGC14_1092640, partial [marine sediment metagenome]
AWEGTETFFLRTVPNLVFQDYSDLSEEERKLHGIEEANERNQKIRETFRGVYGENKRDYEKWIDKHPELQARPEYQEGAFQHPELLKDPNYIAYEFASMVPYLFASAAAATMGTLATGNPVVGIAAASAVLTPVAASEVESELLAAGMPEDQAAEVGVFAGLLIAALEGLGRIPLFRALSPTLMRAFRKEAGKELAQRTMNELAKKGLKTFTVVQASEIMTEVAQEGVGNAAVKIADENRSLIENFGDIAVKTAVAVVPLALLGGGASMVRVAPSRTSGLAEAEMEAKGWLLDVETGKWYEPAANLPEGRSLETPAQKAEARVEVAPVVEEVVPAKVAPGEAAPTVPTRVPPRPAEPTPTTPQQLRESLDEIQQATEEVRKTLRTFPRPIKDLAVRFSNLVLRGAREEIAQAQQLVKRIEAGEALSARETANLEGRVQRLKEQSSMLRLKAATEAEVKQALVNFIRVNAPLNVRGKMLASVKNVRTQAGLEKAIAQTENFVEENSQRILRTQIKNELKRIEGRKQAGIERGKFTPETEAMLKEIRSQIAPKKGEGPAISQDEVLRQTEENVNAFMEGTITTDELLARNETLRFAGVEGMDSEQLAEVLEAIQTLKSEGRTQRQAEREERKAINEANRTEAIGVITGGKGLKPGAESLPVEATQVGGLLSKVNSYQFNWDTVMAKLSQFVKKEKDFLLRFGEKVHAATNEQFVGTEKYIGQVTDAANRIFRTKNAGTLNQQMNRLRDEAVDLGTFKNTEGNEVTLSLTPNQIGDMYHKLQDPTHESNFREGMKWTDEMMGAINKYMNAPENTQFKAWADWIFDFYNEEGGYFDTIAPVFEQTFHTKMPRNRNYSPSPKEGDFGQAGEIERQLKMDESEVLRMFNDGMRVAAATNPSLKSRVENTRPLKFNDMTALLVNHITQMEHFKAFSGTMTELRGVFANPDVRRAIRQYHGKAWLDTIDYYLNSFARGGMDPAQTSRTLDFLRKSFTVATLGVKPVIMLKQVPSVFGYMTTMPTKDFFTGAASFWKAPLFNYNFMLERSPHLRSRFGQGFERDIRDVQAKSDVKTITGLRNFRDVFMAHIRLGDKFAVVQGMWAKLQSELKAQGVNINTATEQQIKDAMFAAENVTRRTQPAFELPTLSRLQGEKSLWKIFTMFQNQPGQYYRMQANALRDIRYGRGDTAKAIQTLLLTWVVLPSLFQFIADAFQFKREHQLRAWVLGPLNFLLVGGQIAQSIYNWVAGVPFHHQASPMFSTLDDLQRAVSKARKLKDPYGDISIDALVELVEALAVTAGQGVGLPTPWLVQAERSVRGAFDEADLSRLKELIFSPWSLESPTPDTYTQAQTEVDTLGEVKEVEPEKAAAFAEAGIELEEFFTDTEDINSEFRRIYGKMLPQEILLDKKASPFDKAWAEKELSAAQADVLPNVPLYRIVEDGTLGIEELSGLWARRMALKTQRELDEFDSYWNDPARGINLVHGNVTQKQIELLQRYETASPEERKQMLADFPALKVNRRVDWFKANPQDNARMALFGKAEIYTMEAYDELQRLVEVLDIPLKGLPLQKVPPSRESAASHFEYLDVREEFSPNSPEAQLVLAKDNEYRLWRKEQFGGFDPVETPIAALELLVKDRVFYDQEDLLRDTLPSIADKEAENYKDGYQWAIEQLKAANQDWVDRERAVEALKKGTNEEPTPQEHVDFFVERGRKSDEFSSGSMEVKVHSADNLESYRWLLDNFEDIEDDGGLPDDDPRVAAGRHSEKWNLPKMRLEADPAQRATQGLFDAIDPADDEAQAAFKADPENKKWLENTWRIEAYEWGKPGEVSKAVAEGNVAWGHAMEKFDDSGPQGMMFRVNDKTGWNAFREALPEGKPGALKPLADIAEDAGYSLERQVRIWTIKANDTYMAADERYGELPDTDAARDAFYRAEPRYHLKKRELEALEKGVPDAHVKGFADFYVQELKGGWHNERWLANNLDYYNEVYLNPDYWPDPHSVVPFHNEPFDLVPDVKHDEIRERWPEQFNRLLVEIPNIVGKIGNPTKRAEERERLERALFNAPRNRGFYQDYLRLLAYDEFRPGKLKEAVAKAKVPMPNLPMLVKDYIGYEALVDKGKPLGWDQSWAEPRYLMEHQDLYKILQALRGWVDKDFSTVPTVEFEKMWNEEYFWLRKPDGTADDAARIQYRRDHDDFDAEGVRVGKFTKLVSGPRPIRFRRFVSGIRRFP